MCLERDTEILTDVTAVQIMTEISQETGQSNKINSISFCISCLKELLKTINHKNPSYRLKKSEINPQVSNKKGSKKNPIT